MDPSTSTPTPPTSTSVTPAAAPAPAPASPSVSCPCGETSNMYHVQGLLFCGACGKKIKQDAAATTGQNGIGVTPVKKLTFTSATSPTDTSSPDPSKPEATDTNSPRHITSASTSTSSSTFTSSSTSTSTPTVTVTSPKSPSAVTSSSTSTSAATSPTKLTAASAATTATTATPTPTPTVTAPATAAPSFPTKTKPPTSPVTSKPAVTSPSSVPKPASSSTTSVPSITSPLPLPSTPSITSTSAIASPRFPSVDGADSITLSILEFSKIEEEIKNEVTNKFRSELDIVSMECDHLQRTNTTLKQECTELKTTLDEVMTSFQTHVDDASRTKADLLAKLGIYESEAIQLRKALEEEKAVSAELHTQFMEMKSTHDDVIAREQSTLAELERLRTEVTNLQQAQSVTQATFAKKLTAAKNEYIALHNKHQQAALEVEDLRRLQVRLESEKSTLDNQLRDLQVSYNKLQKENEFTDATLSETKANLVRLDGEHKRTVAELSRFRVENAENSSIITTYKNQIIELRETNRHLEQSSKQKDQYERDNKQLRDDTTRLTQANNDLKLQLFDLMNKSGNSTSGTVSQAAYDELLARAKQYEADLKTLQTSLDSKVRENEELMSYVESLMTQLEQLKGKES